VHHIVLHLISSKACFKHMRMRMKIKDEESRDFPRSLRHLGVADRAPRNIFQVARAKKQNSTLLCTLTVQKSSSSRDQSPGLTIQFESEVPKPSSRRMRLVIMASLLSDLVPLQTGLLSQQFHSACCYHKQWKHTTQSRGTLGFLYYELVL